MNEPLFSKAFALSIGPQRAATSWIDQYLRARGDVCLPTEIKEVFFFDKYYKKGERFYKNHFHPQDQHDLIMEVSATYFDCPNAAERVLRLCGKDVRFICPLRNPIERSYSLYKHYIRYGIVTGALEEAIKQKPQIIESSHYVKHLKRWADTFGLENITVLFQEELDQSPDTFVQKICQGLHISYIPIPESLQGRVNQNNTGVSSKLAAIAQNGADWFRRRGMYWPMTVAKSIGLRSVVFGKEECQKREQGMTEQERDILTNALGHEKENLEAFLGKIITQW